MNHQTRLQSLAENLQDGQTVWLQGNCSTTRAYAQIVIFSDF